MLLSGQNLLGRHGGSLCIVWMMDVGCMEKTEKQLNLPSFASNDSFEEKCCSGDWGRYFSNNRRLTLVTFSQQPNEN